MRLRPFAFVLLSLTVSTVALAGGGKATVTKDPIYIAETVPFTACNGDSGTFSLIVRGFNHSTCTKAGICIYSGAMEFKGSGIGLPSGTMYLFNATGSFADRWVDGVPFKISSNFIIRSIQQGSGLIGTSDGHVLFLSDANGVMRVERVDVENNGCVPDVLP